jgi:hypothetical protein
MAGAVGFEPTIPISKTGALGQLGDTPTKMTLQIFKEQVLYCNRTKVLGNTLLFRNNKQKTLRTFVSKGLVFFISETFYLVILTLIYTKPLFCPWLIIATNKWCAIL